MRLDADPALLSMVVLLAERVQLDHSQLGTRCGWTDEGVSFSAPPAREEGGPREMGDGMPVFSGGTCAEFVIYLYEQSGIPLLPRELPHEAADDIDEQGHVNHVPAVLAHAFWTGKYTDPVSAECCLKRYPECCNDYERSLLS